jgi:hypothetical protein
MGATARVQCPRRRGDDQRHKRLLAIMSYQFVKQSSGREFAVKLVRPIDRFIPLS